METDSFISTIDHWQDELDRYDFAQILRQPQPDKWSMGQVYMHLISATGFFLSQVQTCLQTDDNAQEEMTPQAKVMFANDQFPDKMVEGPPSNAATPQPASKEEIIRGFEKLKERILALGHSNSTNKGKTKHPGHQYFNADEWLQYAHMHFRHHERQKGRIEVFLEG
ncbi:DinB family protein [uncultured Imperialibacter sp.]|uniref:DinB family protein n=1 Tax=uncultured Imperialibacter sp. TaxID=1672639 RepID=UPI0030D79F1C|tara:strand:+ start:168 stop:668 length:501 start_codon:yes stop_codon:yes gene_type:complete